MCPHGNYASWNALRLTLAATHPPESLAAFPPVSAPACGPSSEVVQKIVSQLSVRLGEESRGPVATARSGSQLFSPPKLPETLLPSRSPLHQGLQRLCCTRSSRPCGASCFSAGSR